MLTFSHTDGELLVCLPVSNAAVIFEGDSLYLYMRWVEWCNIRVELLGFGVLREALAPIHLQIIITTYTTTYSICHGKDSIFDTVGGNVSANTRMDVAGIMRKQQKANYGSVDALEIEKNERLYAQCAMTSCLSCLHRPVSSARHRKQSGVSLPKPEHQCCQQLLDQHVW